MNKKISTLITSLAFLFSICFLPSAVAQESNSQPETIDCQYEDNYLDNLKTPFDKLQKEAAKIGQEICMSSLLVLPNESIAVTQSLSNFASSAKNKFDDLFPDSTFPKISELSENWYQQVTNTHNDYRNFSLIKASRFTDDSRGFDAIIRWDFELYSDVKNTKKKYDFSADRKNHCLGLFGESPPASNDCESALFLWSNAVIPFQYLYTDRVLKNNGEKIANLQSQWKTFINESRYQTPLDVWATTAWYSDQYKRLHLSGPPPTQLFLLHPTIVYEHLPDADKGSKEDVSLAVEWAGINWWQSGFGFSITSVYKDRNDQPSVGTGLTFHIKNKYSLGYAYRDDGDDSIFFNVDLLEWFGEKEEKYKKYRAYF